MTNQEIKTVGQTIAAETQIGGNTAERVGGVIEGIGEALDNKDAAVGYYLATMSGSAIYINASSYRLGTGGNLRAKMPAAATTACTLTVGNANAVPLWYNGAAVSADNSWEAGEIVTIFYDGTRFMASNSQGGGGQFGSGEKIKDILLSQVLGAGTDAITSQKGVSDAIFNEIDISSIDTLKTLNDALAPSSSLKPTYYTVTATLSSVKLKVGSMAVISDNMRHVVTEIMATHYILDDAGNLTNEHSDAEIFFIYRSVKLSGGTLPDPAGVWTKWRFVNSSVWSTAAEKIKYDNSASGLAAENVQGALDEQAEEVTELIANIKTAGLPELSGTQIQKLYIDHTTGVVKSNTTQRSYKYAVNKGDYIVYNYRCDASNSQRYGFIEGEPETNKKAYNYGVHLSTISGIDIMKAPVSGYFLVSNGGSKYPVCSVMSASGKAYKYEELNIFTHKGYLNSSDGTIKSNAAYTYSNKINVNEGDIITVVGGGTTNISTLVMYGSDDSIISYYAPPATTVCTITKVIPSGVAYVRACTRVSVISNSKISVIRRISDELDKIKDDIYGLNIKQDDFYYGYFYLSDGSFCPDSQKNNREMSDIYPVVEGEVLEYRLASTSATLSLCAFDSNLDLVLASSLVGNASSPKGEYTVPQGISYIMGIRYPGTTGYIRSKNRGILPQIKNLETQINNISETDILLNRVGVTTKIYTDHTTGVVTTADSQQGYLYEVKGGDVIKIMDSDLTYNHRYSFFSAYPNIGSQALSYGLEHSNETILTAPTGSMYLMINNNTSYPPVTLYLQGPSSSITRIAECSDILRVFKDERKYIYGYKYNIDINYLGTRSGATLADGVLSVSSGGSAQSAYDLCDDEVRMSCKIKPTSDTFDIRFGRYNTTNGTLIGLRKDSNGSFLDLYKATTIVTSYEFPFSLANNVEYCVNLTKFTLDNTYIDIAIISNNGRSYHLLVGTPESINSAVGADVVQMIGKLWGKVYLASSSGSFEAYSFNMYSPYKQDCQVAVIGHSFVEANSIEGMKLKKFSKLLQGELGIKECGVYGRGGGTMSQSLDVLQHYVGVFYAPKYVLLCVGTNDNSMTLANWKTWANNVISACGAINATPVFFTIPPDSGAYEGQWNSINAFIRTSGYKYVDMDKCFVDSNGNPILSDYLYDGTHPNPETHYAIFQRILADVPEILNLWAD